MSSRSKLFLDIGLVDGGANPLLRPSASHIVMSVVDHDLAGTALVNEHPTLSSEVGLSVEMFLDLG